MNKPIPKFIECVKALRGDSRVIHGWQGRDQYVAKVTKQHLWRCTRCDRYFETLGEARDTNMSNVLLISAVILAGMAVCLIAFIVVLALLIHYA